MEYSIDKAKEELREVNNCLSFYMKKKRALQSFIQEESDRLKGNAGPRSKAWEIMYDKDFMELYGRPRTQREVSRIMGYSLRQVQRFLKKEN